MSICKSCTSLKEVKDQHNQGSHNILYYCTNCKKKISLKEPCKLESCRDKYNEKERCTYLTGAYICNGIVHIPKETYPGSARGCFNKKDPSSKSFCKEHL